jgi:hypothetical protein
VDPEERKIAALIAAFDTEHGRLQGAITALNQTGENLKKEVSSAAKGAVQAALKDLNADIQKASNVLTDLQGLSLWRAALQHLAVAVVAMAIALLGVWWYVPSQSDIAARRAERDELQASIDDLTKRGAKMKTIACGPKSRLCVLVDRAAGTFGVAGNKDDVYMIVKGY